MAKRKNPLAEHSEEQGKSRSQKKRESTALQERGEELAALPAAVQKTLPLSADLREALAIWPDLKTHEARRRHMQYIGRLMREHDEPQALVDALDALGRQSRRSTARLKHLETLRDSLLQADEPGRAKALDDAVSRFPALNRARLAHLAEGALAEREKKRPPRLGRELFRYLRDTLEEDEIE